MSNSNEHLDALKDIRNMMEKSTRFVSLSGFSGVFAGIFALCGAFAAHLFVYNNQPNSNIPYYEFLTSDTKQISLSALQFFILDAAIVLILSVSVSSILSIRKAKKEGVRIWDKTAKRLFLNMMIPLVAGGLFCLILIFHGYVGLVAPAMLVFYGMALINASKYTFEDIRFLGLLEIILGLVAAVLIGYGLLFWAIGFGVLHIVYGILMYFKYEK
jgi:hypothetical protein